MSLVVLFGVMGIGLVLAKVRFGGLSLDISAVVFVGLLAGALGLRIDPVFQSLGLVLFVFSVGIQSGPGFLGSFRRNAVILIAPVVLLVVLSAGLMLLLSAVFHLDPRLALGLLTGARSSNSALAIAVSSTGSNLPSLGHSVAYPLGILGAVALVRFLPLVLRADLKAEAEDWLRRQQVENPPLITRTFAVSNPNLFGRPFASLPTSQMLGVNLSRMMHDGQILVPGATTRLAEGDLVKMVGTSADLEKAELLLGPQVEARDFVDIQDDAQHEAQWVLVTNRKLAGRSLGELGLGENFRATVTRIKRNEVELTPLPSSVLRFGDLVMVVCQKPQMSEVKTLLGGGKPSLDADFLTLSVGVAAGLLLGLMPIPLPGGQSFSLGMTGGVLVVALVLGAVGKTGPLTWFVAESSLRFVRQWGLLLFLAAVGCDAGAHLATISGAQALAMVGTALAISLIPLIVVAWICRSWLKMNVLTLMGLLSGGTTCSPALGISTSLSTSNAATLAYSTVYPFAMIFMMVVAKILSVVGSS